MGLLSVEVLLGWQYPADPWWQGGSHGLETLDLSEINGTFSPLCHMHI